MEMNISPWTEMRFCSLDGTTTSLVHASRPNMSIVSSFAKVVVNMRIPFDKERAILH